jgi:hypothetical protein
MSMLDRARLDPAVFAEVLVGAPLWDHQLAVVRSPARYRVICAGRRAGKTRVFGVLSLHQAFSRARSKVLIVSAGDVASKRMFADISGMAVASPYLAGSVADETKSLLTLSNFSTIECVPASMAQVRSAEADLLIVDEAGFVPQLIWESAEPTVTARPGSRVLICSTPWGAADHFFRVLWRLGMEAPDGSVESWHWPSTVSPLVDEVLLEEIRGRSEPRYFEREYLALWTDDAGAYFTEGELTAAVGDFELVSAAERAALGVVAGGVDWGFARDANALSVIAAHVEPDERGRVRFWVPWVENRHQLAYADWVDELVQRSDVGDGEGGFRFGALVCEANGVGAMPSQVLDAAMAARGRPGVVQTVWTDVRLKESAFGYLKLLMQQGRLGLPPVPELLKQLRGLQFEQMPAGSVRIGVPERLGHDDLAMSLALAVTSVMGHDLPPVVPDEIVSAEDLGLFDDDDEFGNVPSIGGTY